MVLPALRTVPAGILALSRTNACPLSPSGILCSQIFSHSTTSEEAWAWEKYTSDLCLQHRKHAPLTDTLKPLKLRKKTVVHAWKSTKEGMMIWQMNYFTCRLTSRAGCFVMSDSNFSMAHNYSFDQLPVYLASDGWVRFWSERPANLKVVGLCSTRQHTIPFLPNVALLPSEHILLELGRGSWQYKMTSLMDRAKFNPSNCLTWDDAWQWMWTCIGVNEDAYSYWESTGLYFGDPKLPRANWASSARLRCPVALQFPVLTEKVFLVVSGRKPTKNNRALCRLQWHRGLGALGWPKCLSPRLLFTGRHWL